MKQGSGHETFEDNEEMLSPRYSDCFSRQSWRLNFTNAIAPTPLATEEVAYMNLFAQRTPSSYGYSAPLLDKHFCKHGANSYYGRSLPKHGSDCRRWFTPTAHLRKTIACTYCGGSAALCRRHSDRIEWTSSPITDNFLQQASSSGFALTCASPQYKHSRTARLCAPVSGVRAFTTRQLYGNADASPEVPFNAYQRRHAGEFGVSGASAGARAVFVVSQRQTTYRRHHIMPVNALLRPHLPRISIRVCGINDN